MPPAWLTALAWAALAWAGLAWAGHRQHMRIMEAVWPVTGLYFGPVAIAAYRAGGATRAGTCRRWLRAAR